MERQVEGLLRGGLFKEILDHQCAGFKEKYGLKRTDVEVFYYLYSDRKHNTAGDVQRFLDKNKGYISQTLDHLCQLGYITAATDPDDRRYVHYFVTEKAEELTRDIQLLWGDLEDKLFLGISEEERQIFRHVAGILRKNMQEMLTKEKLP